MHTVPGLVTNSNQRQTNNRGGSSDSVAITVLAVVLGFTVLAVIIGIIMIYVKNRLVLNVHYKHSKIQSYIRISMVCKYICCVYAYIY